MLQSGKITLNFASVRYNNPYLHPGFREVNVGGDLFAHGAVGVVRVAEHPLQLPQLVLAERGSNPPLLLGAVELFGVHLVWAVRGCVQRIIIMMMIMMMIIITIIIMVMIIMVMIIIMMIIIKMMMMMMIIIIIIIIIKIK